MKLEEIKKEIPKEIYEKLRKKGYKELRPSQEKSIKAGLFKKKNLLVCTPTASGKTLIAEMAALRTIKQEEKKALYIVPLKALAREKYEEFKKNNPEIKVAVSTGDKDSKEEKLSKYDLIVLTSEKLDSIMRHHSPWLKKTGVVIIDEIHLINDPTRGPTLEIVITLIKKLIPEAQIIGLSATIGNPKELAEWLEAELIIDHWRPVKLHKGIIKENKIIYEQ